MKTDLSIPVAIITKLLKLTSIAVSFRNRDPVGLGLHLFGAGLRDFSIRVCPRPVFFLTRMCLRLPFPLKHPASCPTVHGQPGEASFCPAVQSFSDASHLEGHALLAAMLTSKLYVLSFPDQPCHFYLLLCQLRFCF